MIRVGVTYHAAYEPQRAVRTARYKYIKRFLEMHPGRVLANLDDGLSKDVMLAYGWGDVGLPAESLFDLWLDPSEPTTPPTDHSFTLTRRARTAGPQTD